MAELCTALERTNGSASANTSRADRDVDEEDPLPAEILRSGFQPMKHGLRGAVSPKSAPRSRGALFRSGFLEVVVTIDRAEGE